MIHFTRATSTAISEKILAIFSDQFRKLFLVFLVYWQPYQIFNIWLNAVSLTIKIIPKELHSVYSSLCIVKDM